MAVGIGCQAEAGTSINYDGIYYCENERSHETHAVSSTLVTTRSDVSANRICENC